MDLYKQEGICVPPGLATELKSFMSRYERIVAGLKQNGEMPTEEGKKTFCIESYKHLALHAMKKNDGFSPHIFLLLCWNCMGRSVSIGQLMFNHITWTDDALIVRFPQHKGDKEGKIVTLSMCT